MDASAKPRRSRWSRMILGLVISLVCLWWAVRGMLNDPNAWPQMVSAFQKADYRSLPLIWGILVVFYWLKAVRWRLLLSPVGDFRPVRDLLSPIMIGFAFNNILPARIGEVIRVTVFARQQKVSMTATASSVVLERLFDGIAILVYFAIGLFFVEGLDSTVKQGALGFAAVACCIIAGALVYVIWTKPFVSIFEAILKRIPLLPERVTDKLCRLLERGAQGLAALKDIRLVMAMMVISLVKWGLNGILVLLSLWSFGLPHSVPIAFVLLGAIAFGISIPSSPGYIGVMQAIFIGVMKFFTDNQEAVFASSVYFQFTQWIPVTITGLLCFALTGMSFKQIESRALQQPLDQVGQPVVEESESLMERTKS